jgi:hypothetical protein
MPMFTTEQNISQKSKNASNQGILRFGTTLAKSTLVKPLAIHRIITLALGIIVAMLIALTLWIKSPATTTSYSPAVPKITVPAWSAAIHIVADIIQ